MAHFQSWLPNKRVDQLAMAKTWRTTLSSKASQWNITPAEIAELRDLIEDANEWLAKAMSSERTTHVTAKCKEAFADLINYMRNLKARKFFCPPMTDADFVSLNLKPRDTIKTPIAPPAGQAEVSVTYPGPHLLMFHINPIAGTIIDPKANYGFRIHYGILPPGGATTEQATGPRRYLIKGSPSALDLPHSKFTKRKKLLFDFPPDDSGKTVYVCVRYENSKGQSGPWGPMFSAVIP